MLDKILTLQPEIHVLFVDDNSQDGTRILIEGWMTRLPKQVFMIKKHKKLGLGTAYIAGFKWALHERFDEIIEMDADFSHNPEYLSEMLKNLKIYDVVIGSRYVEGGGTKDWGLIRRMISRFGSLYARLILGTPLKDLTGGFNGWKASTLQRIDLDAVKSEGYAFQIELKHRAFLIKSTIHEFPIIFSDRRVGQSKMSSKIVFEALVRVVLLKFKL